MLLPIGLGRGRGGRVFGADADGAVAGRGDSGPVNGALQFNYPFGLSRIEYAQRREVLCALIETDGNQSAAALSLGISRPTMRAWMRRWHIADEWAEVRLALGVTGSEAGSVDWRLYAVNLGRGGCV